MTRDRRDDTETFSLGTILVKMKVATREQIASALAEQKQMSEEEVLGQLLVARGVIDTEQLQVALNAQDGLRSKSRHTRAMAMSRLAEASSRRVVQLAGAVRRSASEARRLTTGTGHPAITEAVLASAAKE
jgi:hypothetical protein